MSKPRWFDLCDMNVRKAIATELIQGGLEIAFAREFCGVKKMPMQYYLNMRKIKRPYLGVSQRRLRASQIMRAVELYQHGATPQEVFLLTGVALSTLNRMSMLLKKEQGVPVDTLSIVARKGATNCRPKWSTL